MEIIAEQMPIEDVEEINERLQSRLEDAGIDEAEVLKRAREDLVLWDGYFDENVVRGRDDMNFLLRDQWSAVERSEFSRLFKPAMTFNKLYDVFVKKLLKNKSGDKLSLFNNFIEKNEKSAIIIRLI